MVSTGSKSQKILLSAFHATWFARVGTWRRAMVPVGTSLAGLLVYYFIYRGYSPSTAWGEAVSEGVSLFAFVAAPPVLLFFLTFLWEFWFTPYRELTRSISDMEGEFALIRQIATDIRNDQARAVEEFLAEENRAIARLDDLLGARVNASLEEARAILSNASMREVNSHAKWLAAEEALATNSSKIREEYKMLELLVVDALRDIEKLKEDGEKR